MITLLLVTLRAATAGPARAEMLGDTLQPFVSLTETYDSNIFRVRNRTQLEGLVGDDRMGDFITVASVGIGERQLYEETYADRIYSVNDSLGAGLIYQVTAKTRATVGGRAIWKDFRDAPQAAVDDRSDFAYELNTGIAWAPTEKATVDFAYSYGRRDSDDSAFDYSVHAIMARLAYHF